MPSGIAYNAITIASARRRCVREGSPHRLFFGRPGKQGRGKTP
jgi:hypothetical protein